MDISYAPETRRDRITEQWVAFAPTRSERPHRTDAPEASDEPTDSDTPVEGCPFCPGHEEMLPSVVWECGGDGDDSWRTRVVPNKFPALAPDAPAAESPNGLYDARASRGQQDVIIDTPSHHRSPAHFSADQMAALLRTYQERYCHLREAEEDLLPILFRNHGARAGASIDHPHSQLIALSFAPPLMQREEAAARARYDEMGTCPYCAMIETELTEESRLVRVTDAFVAFIPYAAREPYEIWVLPRRHNPEFGRLTESERRALGPLLQDLLWRLYTCLDDPDYNYFIRTALQYQSTAPHLHWSLRIRPRQSVEAGFEQCTDVRVNPSIPERDAAVLRDAAPTNVGE